MASAYRDGIKPQFAIQHEIDNRKVLEIAAAIERGVSMPPILVVEDDGNGYMVLDGNHRAAAYRLLNLTAVAYVVPLDDFSALLIDHFDSDVPNRLTDLDDYIQVDGQSYADLGLRTDSEIPG